MEKGVAATLPGGGFCVMQLERNSVICEMK